MHTIMHLVLLDVDRQVVSDVMLVAALDSSKQTVGFHWLHELTSLLLLLLLVFFKVNCCLYIDQP